MDTRLSAVPNFVSLVFLRNCNWKWNNANQSLYVTVINSLILQANLKSHVLICGYFHSVIVLQRKPFAFVLFFSCANAFDLSKIITNAWFGFRWRTSWYGEVLLGKVTTMFQFIPWDIFHPQQHVPTMLVYMWAIHITRYIVIITLA